MKKLISLLIRYIPRKYLQRVGGLGLKMVGLFYRGNTVTCPVCETSFRTFLPYGRINPRPNALCPNCLSLERHRLLWLYLKEKTNFFTEKLNVLHIAPEACFIKRFEQMHRDGYITADIESPLAKVKMDIHDIPFDENKFDVVLCNHVLEHVEDDIQAMREINRVLKPGGFSILQVPFFNPVPDRTFEDNAVTNPREREKIFGQADHVRRYGYDYPMRIWEAGLKPEEDEFVNELPEATRTKFGLVKGEIIYRGDKRNPYFQFPEIPDTGEFAFEKLNLKNFHHLSEMFEKDDSPFTDKRFRDYKSAKEYAYGIVLFGAYSPKHGGQDWLFKWNGAYAGILHLYDLSLENFADNDKRCWIGFATAPTMRNKGITRKTVLHFIQYIFENYLKIDYIHSYTLKENVPTHEFLLKIGFQKDNTGRGSEKYSFYLLRRNEWRKLEN